MPKRKSTTKPAGTDTTTGSSPAKKTCAGDNYYKASSDYTCARDAESGPCDFKITSWNINGIRSWIKKPDSLKYLRKEDSDVFCFQETKAGDKKELPKEITNFPGYHAYWHYAETKGYSGTGLLSKHKPLSVSFGIGKKCPDTDGRVITAEFASFYLVNAYVPNSGRGLPRLEYRTKTWDVAFRDYIKDLDSKKPVVYTGDLNVSHKEIDLANPKTNLRTAGFTKEERESFSALLNEGFTDSFRHFYPDVKGAYTFWSAMRNARASDTGWRLDYFVISDRFMKSVCDVQLRKDVLGSDHCPIVLYLALNDKK